MSEPTQTTSVIKEYLPFVTSLFGAFFGALGAYWVGRFKESRDEIKRQHTALLATQYALFSQWHVLESIRMWLEPHRKHEFRATRLGVHIHTAAEMVPFDELTFIINSHDPNMLQEIHLAQQAYLQAIKVLGIYNSAKVDFEQRHPPVNLDPATNMSKIEITKDEYHRMKIVVDMLYATIDDALPKFDKQIKSIHAFVKCYFAGKKKAIPGIQQLEAATSQATKKG